MQEAIEGFRVSSQQQHLWRLWQDGADHRVEGAVLLEGEVCEPALREALRELVERHEILRTTFQTLPGIELPLQVIGDSAAADLREEWAGDGEDPESAVARELAAERLRPFDPAAGPLARFTLLHLGGGRRALVISLSALVADPLTLDNVFDQLARSYAQRMEGAEPDAEWVQYADFSEWQGSLAEETEAGRAYWAAGLGPVDLADPLAPYQNGDRRSAGSRPETLVGPMSPDLVAAAGELAAAAGEPLATVLLALWCAVICRLAGRAEIVVGTQTDGRSLAPLREAVGPFARYLPLRCRLEEHFGLRDAVHALGEAWRQAEAHQQSFAPETLGTGPRAVGFDFRGVPPDRVVAGVRFRRLWEAAVLDHFRVRLSAVARDGALALELHYDPAFFTPDDGRLLLERCSTLLRGALAAPEQPLGDLEILSPAERQRVLIDDNRTAREVAWDGPFHRLVELQAERTPEAAAVVADGLETSFRDLDRQAGRLAAWLERLGVRRGARVALCLDRSVELVAAALAVLKAGAAFVPLDPGQPRERLRFMLEKVEARAVVTRTRTLPAIPEGASTVVLDRDEDAAAIAREDGRRRGADADPDDLAYVIFTSGSTGRPKGVLVRHGSLVNLLHALGEAVYDGAAGPLRVSLNAPLSFDAAIKQLAQLARGCTLCVVPEEIRADGRALLAFLREHRVDVLDCTPTQLRLLLDAGLAGPGAPGRVLVGGEAIEPALWEALAADRERRYDNVYGPTECTVDATACRVAPGPPSLGRPLANVRLYVLDERLRPVPEGAAGELFIGGAGLARGYARRPDLTAERFVPDSFSGAPGERLYRTGDRVRRRPGGLEFLGRVDQQIKLRGYRIEPGEIEAVLREHPAVDAAVVEAREDLPGNRRLVAYVVPHHRQAALGGRRRHRLPNGMAIVEQNRNETDYLFREIFEKCCYAKGGLRFPASPVVLDVGANIGMFSLFVACHRPAATILAFEPLAPIFETLQLNAGFYAPAARLFPFGLADRERREEFVFYPRYTMMSGTSASADPEGEVRVIKRFLENARAQEAGEAQALLAHADELLEGRFEGEIHEVRLRRLSDLLREQGLERVDLLKVDVQRAEMDVLRGIDEADWPKIRQIVMEVHDAPGTASDGRLAAIAALLRSRGFAVTSEQDELLVGTDRHNLYAVRPGAEGTEIGDGAAAPPERPAAELEIAELRELARARLPEAMLPSAYVLLEELPLTRNGKVNRAALPPPEEAAGEPALVEPRTPFEAMMAPLWMEVLGTDRVGADSNFFELGGHSLLATQLMSRVREVFAVELPLRALFDSPTVAGLAQRAEEAMRAASGLLAPPVTPVPRSGELPLSFAQQRLWFIDQLAPGETFYVSHQAFRVEGRLDAAVLARTLAEVVRRHEVLRTGFPAVDGRPVQRILLAVEVPLSRIDLSALPATVAESEVRRLAAADALRRFDLSAPPLLRVTLLDLGPELSALLFSMHHIVSDAWSLGILVREAAALYGAYLEQRPSPLPELPVQYADFGSWQRQWLQGEALAAHLSYWRQRLGSPLPRLELPVDRQRSGVPTHRGRRSTFRLPEDLPAALAALSRAQGVTLFITLLAGFKALLARLGGQQDLIVGTAIAGRNRVETEGLIGFFINMLPLRTDLSGNPTFLEILARVREAAVGAYAHQDLPFEKLVEELQPERDCEIAPLVRVAFGLQNVPSYELALPGVRLATIPVESDAARFDLTVWMWEDGTRLAANWTYSTDLFEPATIANLHAGFAALLAHAVSAPQTRLNELELVSATAREEQERRRLERESANQARLRRSGRAGVRREG